jgi:hypothetical protein
MRARESGRAPSGSCGRDAIDQSIGEGWCLFENNKGGNEKKNPLNYACDI